MDKDTWRFINTFAPWASALGTFSAVVTSLYLARRTSSLDLQVSASIVKAGRPGAQEPWVEFFQVRAVNHRRDAVVKGISWKLRGSKQQWIVLPPDDPYSTKLPARLAFGEDATFYFPTASFNRLARPLLEAIKSSKFPWLVVRRLRVGIYTSTGQTFETALDAQMRRFLLSRAGELN